MQAEVKNGNGRIYPKDVLFEATKPLFKSIKENKLMGELNHPSQNSHMINPANAAIAITELTFSGTDVLGKAKVLKSVPSGRIVHGLLSEGVVLGVSSRGFGEVKRNSQGVSVVQSPLVLKTVDVVTDPSAPDAYVNAVMENREWVYEEGVLIEREKQIKALINENVRHKEDTRKTFNQILSIILNSKSTV